MSTRIIEISEHDIVIELTNQGPRGRTGPAGQDGTDGQDGISPIATVTKSGKVATISITDVNGTTTASVSYGNDGAPGQDGAPGADGQSATIAVGTVTTLPAGSDATVTNSGTSSAAVLDFGIPEGEQGDPGVSEWGSITGTLSDQTDLQSALDSKADIITRSVSDSLIHITDGVPRQVSALSVSVEPVQAGSGDPAPDNIRAISGWSSVNLTRTGKNVLNYTVLTWTDGARNDSGNPESSTTAHYSSAIKVAPSTTYTISGTLFKNSAYWRIYYLQADGTWINRTSALSANVYTFTTPSNCGLIQIQCRNTNTLDDVQLEISPTATAYEAYTAQQVTVSLGDTCYGGTLDVLTGTLTIDRGILTLDGDNRKVTGVWGATTNGYAVYTAYNIQETSSGRSKYICDKFKAVTGTCSNMPLYSFVGSSGSNGTVTFILPDTVTSKAEADAWFASNPTDCRSAL